MRLLSTSALASVSVAALMACTGSPTDAGARPSFVIEPSPTAPLSPPPPVPYRTVATGTGNGGALQVILLGAKDSLPYLIYQTTGGTWYASGRLPDPNNVQFSAMATGIGNGGALQVILLGAKDSLPYLIYQTTGGTWYWGGLLPNPNGVRFRSIATGKGNAGNLQVMGIGASNGLPYLIYQVNSSGTWYWAGQTPSTGVQFSLAGGGFGGSLGDGTWRLYMATLGATNGLLYWVSQSDGAWGSFNGPPGNVPLASLVSLRLPLPDGIRDNQSPNCAYSCYYSVGYFLSVGASDKLPYLHSLDRHTCYFPNEHTCFDWVWRGPLPNPNGVQFGPLAAALGNSGNPQVIGLGASDGFPYLIYQDNNFNANWHWHGLLPDPGVPFSAVATGTGNGGSLQVILLGKNDGLPYLIYQNTGGAWYWGGLLPNVLQPPPPPPPLNITLAGPASVRPGATCLWTATPTNGVAPYSYSWNLPNGSSTPGELIYQNSGSNFTVTVQVNDAAGASGSKSKSVTISGSAPMCQF